MTKEGSWDSHVHRHDRYGFGELVADPSKCEKYWCAVESSNKA